MAMSLNPGLGQLATGRLSLSTKRVPFSNQGWVRKQKERDVLRLSYAVPKPQRNANFHCPYSY